jgi:hypothetical protein
MTAAAENPVLSASLAEAGWSPRALAREINTLFGAATVSETAPYYWRDSDGVPHPPLPALTAHVLSQRLGRPVEVTHLWRGLSSSTSILLATSGLDLAWTVDSTVRVAQDWAMAGLIERRVFLAVTGAALAQAVWTYLVRDTPVGQLAAASHHDDNPLITQIERSIPMLQRLDDARGGAASLGYVGAQVRAVSLVLAEGVNGTAVTRRLIVCSRRAGTACGVDGARRRETRTCPEVSVHLVARRP